MISGHSISLFLSAILTGLVAGLLYSYQCSVIPGLANLGDREYLTAFQSINKEIQNPLFFLSFFGVLLILPTTSWLSYGIVPSVSFYLMVAAFVTYLIGVMGVTVVGNVPLNEALAGIDLSVTTDMIINKTRTQFEMSWNSYHVIRTTASIITFSLTVLSILVMKKS